MGLIGEMREPKKTNVVTHNNSDEEEEVGAIIDKLGKIVVSKFMRKLLSN